MILEFQHILLFYIHMNNIKFTYVKLESVKIGFSILYLFSQVLRKLFTLLIITTDK